MPHVRHHFWNHTSVYYYCLRWFILLAFGLIIYAQSFGFGFVFDDHIFIVTNEAITDFKKLNEIWGAFPLTRLIGMYSFAFNYMLNQLNPAGYHIFNFIVHILTTALVWGTAGLLFRIRPAAGMSEFLRRELPFVIALLFLVHPCQTQAITYISQRFESLATMFYLAAIYYYLCARTSTAGSVRILFWAATAVSVVLGILSKETAFTIPYMILLVELMIIRKGGAASFLRWPHVSLIFAACLVFAAIWIKLGLSKLDILFSSVVSESHDGDILAPFQYALTQMRVFLTFARLLVFPVNQNLEYDYPMSTGLFSPPLTFIGLCLVAAMLALVYKIRRRLPLIAFGLVWLLVTFSINLVPRPNVIFEHKLYLISFGFFLAATTALAMLIRSPKVLSGMLVIVVIVLTIVSVQRNHVWSREQLLWEDALKKSPGKARVYANLSRIYSDGGRDTDALELMNKAVLLRPDEYMFYVNRGIIFSRLGMPEEALKDFDKAISLNPRLEVYMARAEFYLTQNKEDNALADLAEAIRILPQYQNAYIVRGSFWMRKGQYEAALSDFNRALAIAPHNYGALINRGAVYFSTGNYEKALTDFTHAHSIEPTELTHKNRAYCLLALNQIKEARKEFEAALVLNPDDAQTRAQYEKIKP